MPSSFQCYNFVSQDVLLVPATSDFSLVSAASSKLFIAQEDNIFLYDLASSGSASILSLKCLGFPLQIFYCEYGNVLCTVEVDEGKSQNYVVRIYNKWWLRGEDCKQSNSSNSSSQIEALEISRERFPCKIACCSKRGSIGILSNKEVKIYNIILHSSVPSVELAINISFSLCNAVNFTICENYVMLYSESCLQVFRIDDNAAFADRRVQRAEGDDDTFVEWNFNSNDPEFGKWKSETRKVVDPLSFMIPFDACPRKDTKKCVFGPLVDVPGAEAAISNDEYIATLMLSVSLDEPVICATFLPYYVIQDAKCPLGTSDLSAEKSFSPSKQHTYLKAMSFLLATTKRATVYDLNDVHIIGDTYIFPQDMLSAACDQCFFYTLSEFTFDTFTIPLPDELFEYTNRANCFFRVSTKTMLAMEYLLNTQNNILVFSTPDEGSNRTVYSLLKPTSSEFFADLMQANEDVETSVMQKGLQVIQVQIGLHGEHRCSHFLLDTYRSSCALLVDRLLMTGKKKDAKNAVYFYELCGRPLEDILDRLIEFPKVSASKFLKICVKHRFLSEKRGSSVASHTLIASTIQGCLTYNVPVLAKLILLSDSRFKSAACVEPLVALDSFEAKLALVLIYRSVGKPEEAQQIMQSFQHSTLLINLRYYKAVTDSSMSDLGRALYAMRPRLFMRYILQLVSVGQLDPLRVAELMIQCHPDLPLHRVPLLRDLVEANWKPQQEEFVLLLTEIYTRLLCDGIEASEKWSGDLPIWLKLLPPFYGRELSKDCSGEEDCNCVKCRCYLLKLICLLNSQQNEIIAPRLLEVVNQLPENEQFFGVKMILKPDLETAQSLLKMCPQAVLHYMRRSPVSSADVTMWKQVCALVLKSDLDGGMKEILSCNLLTHLCEYVPLDSLVTFAAETMRSCENFDDISVMRDIGQKWKAMQLKRKISSLGTELKLIID